jgi:hypothetical protein
MSAVIALYKPFSPERHQPAIVVLRSITRFRIGYDRNVWTDNLGTIIASGIFIYTVIAYSRLEGY